ncbi:M50 family metallopeptidase [Pelotomaculum propionicicum]|uniref:Putative zinc metalloprotease Rip3 n=1 Tax=Pelotomaculum propionicicum TaxID=258475 RepID=A0A4Y7RWV4_9FIRM|nr:M50 family metallopeptidase [Pelotomaculum propionicicum]NLI14610.1 peptidase M50 [Peptococcaceae bacterium]TEB12757.1 putative zinc metalloprotease Rip3 [Pelotomaculum propionicicum]
MRLCRISGVEIHLNNAFLALLGLFLVAGVLMKGVIAFTIVLLHELAHVAAARHFDVHVSDIELLPFGGVSRIGGEVVLNPSKEVFVAAAGPTANLMLAGLGTALQRYGLWDADLGPFFLQCNLLVASFNLLPALPLDGGRVYRAFLARRVGFKQATYKAAWLGQFWGVLIVLGGTAGLALGVSGLDVLITGLFLLYAATREKSLAPFHFIRHLTQKKEELAAAGVLPGEPLVSLDTVRLGDVLRSFLPQRFHVVLLLDRNWQYRGVVSEAQIVDALLNQGMDIPIGSLIKKKS